MKKEHTGQANGPKTPSMPDRLTPSTDKTKGSPSQGQMQTGTADSSLSPNRFPYGK